MIWEWKLDEETRNYGDALWEIVGATNDSTLVGYMNDTKHAHCLIGSVICNQVMDDILSLGQQPVFHNCGWRGEKLDKKLVGKSIFTGCRGPATRRELLRAGKSVIMTADPARYVSLAIDAGKPRGVTVFMPHILDPHRDAYTAESVGVDEIISPVVHTHTDIVRVSRAIGSADFVLAGAMHAAIVAHSYGVPFAPFRSWTSAYVDCAAKWEDWFEWLGLERDVVTASENFAPHREEGHEWWMRHGDTMRR